MWVDCNERLPQENVGVQIVTTSGKVSGCYVLSSSDDGPLWYHASDRGGTIDPAFISHWAPFLTPPNSEVKELGTSTQQLKAKIKERWHHYVERYNSGEEIVSIKDFAAWLFKISR